MNLNIPGMSMRSSSVFNRSQPAQTHVRARQSEEAPKAKNQFQEIQDKGFSTYVSELQQRKKEELRKKILGEMGLTEEILSKMSPKQRAAIEKIVNMEMNKRMTAEAELDQHNKQPITMHSNPTKQGQMSATAKTDGAGVGIGPLLALQDIQHQTNVIEDKKDQTTG